MSDQQFTDIHHHILYGLDDGAKSQNRMYEMLKLAAENGISRIVATPHVTPGVFEFDVEQYHTALAEAQAYCDENGLGIRMDAGAEILFSEQTCRFLRDGRAPTMVGTDRVLVEFSPDVSYTRLRDALEQICMSGFTPIVAHVERYYCISQSVKLAIQLKKELDIRYQMNCATVLSQSGFFELAAQFPYFQGLETFSTVHVQRQTGYDTVCLITPTDFQNLPGIRSPANAGDDFHRRRNGAGGVRNSNSDARITDIQRNNSLV